MLLVLLLFLAPASQATPATSAGTQVTLDPLTIDHTLPDAFWGVTRPPYFHQDVNDPSYVNLVLALQPELFRPSVPPSDTSLPTNMGEYWTDQLQLYADLQQAAGTKLHPVLYSSPQKPIPTSIDPWTISNYNTDAADARSPEGMVAWVDYLQQTFGSNSIAGIEPFNEPGNLGNGAGGGDNGDWYSAATSPGQDPGTLAGEWAIVHVRQYTDALKAAGGNVATVPVYGASFSTGAKTSLSTLTWMTAEHGRHPAQNLAVAGRQSAVRERRELPRLHRGI